MSNGRANGLGVQNRASPRAWFNTEAGSS